MQNFPPRNNLDPITFRALLSIYGVSATCHRKKFSCYWNPTGNQV